MRGVYASKITGESPGVVTIINVPEKRIKELEAALTWALEIIDGFDSGKEERLTYAYTEAKKRTRKALEP